MISICIYEQKTLEGLDKGNGKNKSRNNLKGEKKVAHERH